MAGYSKPICIAPADVLSRTYSPDFDAATRATDAETGRTIGAFAEQVAAIGNPGGMDETVQDITFAYDYLGNLIGRDDNIQMPKAS